MPVLPHSVQPNRKKTDQRGGKYAYSHTERGAMNLETSKYDSSLGGLLIKLSVASKYSSSNRILLPNYARELPSPSCNSRS